MYAIIEESGQQFKVASGDVIQVQRPIADTMKELEISKVLFISRDDTCIVGKPYIEKASVTAEVQGVAKGPKVLVYKQKPRKGFRKLRGHRQNYTILKIKDIVYGG